ncbi:MAG: NrfD/PsrC family molybdoenzyme membrane anchor subunit [Chloroflexota bacterium]|nr:NrfD/PsrC family molybdoenzyme membrane anchor subunit [Chloroflexota bacterium]
MTAESTQARRNVPALLREYLFMDRSMAEYLRSLVTPWNALAALILSVGIPVSVVRFTQGLAATTNLSDTTPWGLWIGVDVLGGVALAAGGYTMGVSFHVFGLKEYRPLVRPAILTGFIGYLIVVVGLLYDLGRPWRLPYPMFVSFGLTSVLFLVAWHFALYILCQFLEFTPTIFEWLNMRRLWRWAERLTLWVTIAGAIVATGHQSALGSLYLMAPGKLHPLWYSPLLPLFFFISSIAAGVSVVIVESTLSHRAFHRQMRPGEETKISILSLGLAKAGSAILFAYFWLKVVGIAAGNAWGYLNTGPGYWFLVEMLLFVLLPSGLFLLAARERSVRLARITSFMVIAGIVLNRLNVSIIAFNWQDHTYVPMWTEVVVTITLATVGILAFRWMVNRMPVLREHPAYRAED